MFCYPKETSHSRNSPAGSCRSHAGTTASVWWNLGRITLLVILLQEGVIYSEMDCGRGWRQDVCKRSLPSLQGSL